MPSRPEPGAAAEPPAHVDISFVEAGPVAHGARIVAFAARPTGDEEMVVTPQSGLQVALSHADTGVPWNRSVDELLTVVHHYVEHSVIDGWFRYGVLPPE